MDRGKQRSDYLAILNQWIVEQNLVKIIKKDEEARHIEERRKLNLFANLILLSNSRICRDHFNPFIYLSTHGIEMKIQLRMLELKEKKNEIKNILNFEWHNQWKNQRMEDEGNKQTTNIKVA